MSDIAPTEIRPKVITIGKKQYSMEQAENAAKSAGNWFCLIAGLSLVNSISSLMHWDLEMVLGLGLLGFTRLIRVAIDAKSEEFGITTITAAMAYGVVALLTAAFFYYLGVKARKLSLTAFQVGMAVYLADAVLLATVGEWIGFAFHAFVLFMVWCGYGIARQIVSVPAELPPSAT
ncbi:MAG: hypothetical protein MUF23_11945 [Pirellula sp.]|nr:hypothetical protein [Pirellula sp.]